MADHDRPYDIDIDYVDPKTQQQVKFKMRNSNWATDMNFQQRFQTPEGRLNLKELWIARILDTVEGLDDAKVRNLDSYTMNVLITKWLDYNDPNSSFLGIQNPEGLQMNSTS